MVRMKGIEKLFEIVYDIEAPWMVVDCDLDREAFVPTVEIVVERDPEAPLACPVCGRAVSHRHDVRDRRWRAVDWERHRVFISCQVPRIRCPEHGFRQLPVAWADFGERMTRSLERWVIDELADGSLTAVARRLGVSWDVINRVQKRAVERGRARKTLIPPTRLGIDETSFRRRHHYITAFNDMNGNVLHVAEGRGRDTVDGFLDWLGATGRAALQVVAMDMWPAYAAAVRERTGAVIAFDRFHVMSHIGRAVDQVRRQEHRELAAHGDRRLTGSKHLWLTRPERLEGDRRSRFERLRDSSLKTSRAWWRKDMADHLWNFPNVATAKVAWKEWIRNARHSKQKPVKKVADMVANHLDGIAVAASTGVTNAHAESLNSKIQKIKRIAHGYRNMASFINAIYFHCGGLSMYP